MIKRMIKEKYRNHISREPYCYMCDCLGCKLYHINSKLLLNPISERIPFRFWDKLLNILTRISIHISKECYVSEVW